MLNFLLFLPTEQQVLLWLEVDLSHMLGIRAAWLEFGLSVFIHAAGTQSFLLPARGLSFELQIVYNVYMRRALSAGNMEES